MISDDQGGFACLEALLKGPGRRQRRHTRRCRRRSQGLSREKEGEETVNIKQTIVTQSMTWRYAVPGVS